MALLHELIQAIKSENKHGTMFSTQEPVCMYVKLERIQRMHKANVYPDILTWGRQSS